MLHDRLRLLVAVCAFVFVAPSEGHDADASLENALAQDDECSAIESSECALALLQYKVGRITKKQPLSPTVPLTFLDEYPEARCMDGSPAGFYFRRASSNANAARWIIHLQGGAECSTAEDCIEKTQTDLGSSKQWPPKAKMANFLLDEGNPSFGSWNAVVLPYCSGDMWLGTQLAPNVTMAGIQFSGHNVVKAAVEHLRLALGLDGADTLILSGDSIGGVAVFAHLDYMREQLPDSVHVVGAPFGVVTFPQSEGDLRYRAADPPPGPITANISASGMEALYFL